MTGCHSCKRPIAPTESSYVQNFVVEYKTGYQNVGGRTQYFRYPLHSKYTVCSQCAASIGEANRKQNTMYAAIFIVVPLVCLLFVPFMLSATSSAPNYGSYTPPYAASQASSTQKCQECGGTGKITDVLIKV